jgi:hypothetical protein
MEVLLEAAPSPCICTQRGYCPRNPDGACRCNHHEHTPKGPNDAQRAHAAERTHQGHRGAKKGRGPGAGASHTAGPHAAVAPAEASGREDVRGGSHEPQGPVMRSCDTGMPDGLRSAVVLKWVAAPAVELAAPRRFALTWPAPPVRRSQCAGSDVVVPPWRA